MRITTILLASVVAVGASSVPIRAFADCGPGPEVGHWRCSKGQVNQSASVAQTDDGLTVGIQIQNQDQVPEGSPGTRGGVILEQPKGRMSQRSWNFGRSKADC
jgi:hypothetical protein